MPLLRHHSEPERRDTRRAVRAVRSCLSTSAGIASNAGAGIRPRRVKTICGDSPAAARLGGECGRKRKRGCLHKLRRRTVGRTFGNTLVVKVRVGAIGPHHGLTANPTRLRSRTRGAYRSRAICCASGVRHY
jgi:hypothetical protein